MDHPEQPTLLPGDVVAIARDFIQGVSRQPEPELGILVRRAPRPSAAWLAEQVDSRMRFHSQNQWWSVMPLGGGLILVPEPLLVSLGRATREQVMQAVDHGNVAARRTIAELFPEIVAELLQNLTRTHRHSDDEN
jgi:hypothetical protein